MNLVVIKKNKFGFVVRTSELGDLTIPFLVWEKNRLYNNCEISESVFDKIKYESEYFEAKNYAMRLLTKRSYFENELRRKLLLKKKTEQIIKALISEIIDLGFINDEKFAEEFVEYKIHIRKFGLNRISNELKRKGVDSLDYAECLLGSQVAKILNLKENEKLKIQDKEFTVAKLLGETGTVDDDRIFVNLKAAQDIFGIPDQISAIEIMGCCNAISDGLLGKLRNILPDTRITTINQIVSTQIETNKMMNKTSVIFLIIILFVGSISIGNYMWANVNERKKEIGILRMIGTLKSEIYKILLVKATVLGLFGGILGYLLGTISAYYLGPVFAQIQVSPIPIFVLWAVLISVGISILGSILPAYFAAKIEPFSNMQEE